MTNPSFGSSMSLEEMKSLKLLNMLIIPLCQQKCQFYVLTLLVLQQQAKFWTPVIPVLFMKDGHFRIIDISFLEQVVIRDVLNLDFFPGAISPEMTRLGNLDTNTICSIRKLFSHPIRATFYQTYKTPCPRHLSSVRDLAFIPKLMGSELRWKEMGLDSLVELRSRMAELAGDFGKLRLPLPKTFSGEPSDWEDWSWNFKSYLAIFQQDSVDFLARSETSNTEIVDAHFTSALPAEEAAEMRMFSRKLHYLLANLCTGSARLLVRQNEAGNGFETWCRLSQRFSLPDATRHVSLLTRILEWKFNTQTFEQVFNAWETVKAKYKQQTGTPIPDSVLVATLMNKTSGALQQHLRLNAATINTYKQMRNTMVQYFRSRRILTSSDSGLAPMDIGALKGKGYFKGKGKGKGKGFGHWNFTKGKGGKSKGKGKGKDCKGNKGKEIGKTSHKGKGK